MKVYIASAFGNKAEVQSLRDKLVAAGHTITRDWTLEEVPTKPMTPAERTAFDYECGMFDYQAVMDADALVLVQHPDSKNAQVELGIALGSGAMVAILHDERKPLIFSGLCVRRNTEDEIVTWLSKLSD